MRDTEVNDKDIETWAGMILQEASRLVELLGEAEDHRHLNRPQEHPGVLVDMWHQPPLEIMTADSRTPVGYVSRPTEDITMDERRLNLREEVQSLAPRLKQAYILVSGMRRGIERKHNEWMGKEAQ